MGTHRLKAGSTPSPAAAQRSRLGSAIFAGTVGNILEWYDFALYGFMASILSGLFFPGDDPLVSLIATYGVFAVGFVMRPLGSVLFGWLGDTIGRSRTLVLSVAMMALPTMVLGLLPTHDAIGTLAPVALIVVRMIQGLSVGGEFSTSVTYLVETAPSGRRGFAGSWANIGSLAGMLLGSGAASLVTNLMEPEVVAAWGWRLPFLFGGVLGIVALALRRGLPESPHFQRYEAARCPDSPLREAFECNRPEMVQGMLFASGYGALFYLALVYLPTWIGETTDVPLAVAMQANTLTLALMLPVIPLAGWLSGRWVRRTHLLAAAFVLLGAAGTAAFVWMAAGGTAAVILGQVATGMILAVPLGAAPALFTELFPEDDRLTGYSIVFNAGRAGPDGRQLADPENGAGYRACGPVADRRRDRRRDASLDARPQPRAAAQQLRDVAAPRRDRARGSGLGPPGRPAWADIGTVSRLIQPLSPRHRARRWRRSPKTCTCEALSRRTAMAPPCRGHSRVGSRLRASAAA